MKTCVYSVFDSKAAVYGVPFFMPKDAMAVRAFTDLANDPNSTVAKHPEDYTLFKIGEYDDQLGSVEGHEAIGLVTASAVVNPVGRGMKKEYFESALPFNGAKSTEAVK